MSEPAVSIEKSLERIESLVREIEAGQLPLEEVIVRFEEGAALVKSCQEKLDAAERRIKIIMRDASGAASLADFAPEEE